MTPLPSRLQTAPFNTTASSILKKNLDGRITALKTNMSEINHLKTDILNIINDEILALDTADIGIPLGSYFCRRFFSGKGPAIPVHILSIRNSDATFESNFSRPALTRRFTS